MRTGCMRRSGLEGCSMRSQLSIWGGVRADNPGVRIWERVSKHSIDHVPLASLMNHCMFFYDHQLNWRDRWYAAGLLKSYEYGSDREGLFSCLARSNNMLVTYGFTAVGRQSIASTYRRPIKSCKGFHIETSIDYTLNDGSALAKEH